MCLKQQNSTVKHIANQLTVQLLEEGLPQVGRVELETGRQVLLYVSFSVKIMGWLRCFNDRPRTMLHFPKVEDMVPGLN